MNKKINFNALKLEKRVFVREVDLFKVSTLPLIPWFANQCVYTQQWKGV